MAVLRFILVWPSPVFEIAFVFVRCEHVARLIVNANHGVPSRLAKSARFFQNSAHMANPRRLKNPSAR
jgi:hypothetical protein